MTESLQLFRNNGVFQSIGRNNKLSFIIEVSKLDTISAFRAANKINSAGKYRVDYGKVKILSACSYKLMDAEISNIAETCICAHLIFICV